MLGRVLTRLFALFGMTLTCVACYGVEYTEYREEFSASGRVVDSDGNPIPGIRASVANNHTTTDNNGWFFIRGYNTGVYFMDVDGEENGGSFKSRTITTQSTPFIDLGDVVLYRVGEEEPASEQSAADDTNDNL